MIEIKQYLTVRQVAEKLDITESWVRDLIRTGEIKATKIGKWRVCPDDLINFINLRTNRK